MELGSRRNGNLQRDIIVCECTYFNCDSVCVTYVRYCLCVTMIVYVLSIYVIVCKCAYFNCDLVCVTYVRYCLCVTMIVYVSCIYFIVRECTC